MLILKNHHHRKLPTDADTESKPPTIKEAKKEDDYTHKGPYKYDPNANPKDFVEKGPYKLIETPYKIPASKLPPDDTQETKPLGETPEGYKRYGEGKFGLFGSTDTLATEIKHKQRYYLI